MQQSEHEQHRFNEVREESSVVSRPLEEEAFPPIKWVIKVTDLKYNANFDKGSLTVYGFTEDYPLVESWEFLNNTSDACLFHGPVPDDWTEDFEARYPDEYNDISAFKVMHDWVVSTWQDGATGSALGVTYAGTDGKTYTTDTAEYRLAKFKKEFTEHFDFGFSLLYYVYTFVMLMVDQRAKNMFLTSWDKVHYQPWFYDNDFEILSL